MKKQYVSFIKILRSTAQADHNVFEELVMAADVQPMTLQEAQYLYEKPAYSAPAAETDSATLTDELKAQKNEGQKARSQAILDTALGVGVKLGLAWQLTNINKAVVSKERDFDTLYDFSYLMIRDRVVPPVITEARDLYNQEGDFALRLSGAFYKIEYQARFSSTAPNWRDYLTFKKPIVDNAYLYSALMPRDDEEEKIWQLAVADGWKQGVDQANLMLQYGMDRMNRDLTGMLRFNSFVMQGKISMPAIASESIPVTHAGKTMAVDETLLRITTLPEFNEKMERWSSVIVKTGENYPAPVTTVSVKPYVAVPSPAPRDISISAGSKL